MMRFVRPIIGAAFAAGALALGIVGASAASTSSTTTLSLTVPTTITMSGLNASYSATIPAGTSAAITTGPLSIATNNTAGFTLNVKAGSTAFLGASASFPNNADHLSLDACPVSAACAGGDFNNTQGTDLVNTHNAAAVTVSVIHTITVTPTQAGDIYVNTAIYTATAN